jgi:hypothetical protein
MLRMASQGRCADRLLTEDGHTSVHGTSASPVEAALVNTSRIPVALLSSDDFGSSVERAAKLHPLWQGLRADQASDAVQLWMTEGVASGYRWVVACGGM